MKSANNPHTYHDRSIPAEPPMLLSAPPLGRWTREWCQNGFARKEIVQYGLDAMRADVLMYERHVARDPSNEVFQDWLRHTQRALAELEAWVNARQGDSHER